MSLFSVVKKNGLLVGGVPRIKVYHSKERTTCISRKGKSKIRRNETETERQTKIPFWKLAYIWLLSTSSCRNKESKGSWLMINGKFVTTFRAIDTN